MRLHRLAQIGDDAFADPADEIETERRGDAHDDDDAEHCPEIGRHRRRVRPAGKAIVDDQLEPLRNGEGGQRGDDQRGQGSAQLCRIGAGKTPEQDKPAQLPGFGGGSNGLIGHGT